MDLIAAEIHPDHDIVQAWRFALDQSADGLSRGAHTSLPKLLNLIKPIADKWRRRFKWMLGLRLFNRGLPDDLPFCGVKETESVISRGSVGPGDDHQF